MAVAAGPAQSLVVRMGGIRFDKACWDMFGVSWGVWTEGKEQASHLGLVPARLRTRELQWQMCVIHNWRIE